MKEPVMDQVAVVGSRMGNGPCGERELGGSLVGLLVVLVAIGAMAALAVSALSGNLATDPLSGLAPTSPGHEAASGPAGAAGLTGAAAGAACRSDVATLESAMGAAQAVNGTYPASLAELRAMGFVSELPDRPGLAYSPEVAGTSGTGRILVNGLRADEGCR